MPWARGFSVGAQVALDLLSAEGVKEEILGHYAAANPEDPNDIMIRSFAVGRLLDAQELGEALTQALSAKFRVCGFDESTILTLRSPGSNPLDNPTRVRGLSGLLKSLKRLYREHFANGLVHRFEQPDYDPFERLPSWVIQQSPACQRSGIVTTFEPKSGHPDFVVVLSTWGLAEDISRRTVARDEYWFHKRCLELGAESELFSRAGEKQFLLYYDSDSHRLEHLDLSREKARSYSITRPEALLLAQQACALESSAAAPVELCWCADEQGLMLLEAGTPAPPSEPKLRYYRRKGEGQVLVTGHSASHAAATGRVRVISGREQLSDFAPGEVLVASKTEPDWEPAFRRAAAIVTEHDRRVSHSSILAREMGIPAILGASDCHRKLRDGQTVTVSCCEGERGVVYAGQVEHAVQEFSLERMPALSVELMVNLSLPERALSLARHPWSGAGLVRSEFLIGGWVKAHPLALLYPDRLTKDNRSALQRLLRSETPGRDYFLQKMTQGLGLIAGAFWPRPVTVRFSDFKSNEYSRLLGGQEFEPKEATPMLGWRGASRYLHPEYEEAFELELEAVKRLREQYGFTNIKVMVPFCRTPEEGHELKERIDHHFEGCSTGSPEVWVMAELPSNVLLAREFAQLFSGLSIGSSDLTQLVMGVSRESERVSEYFDEMHPALLNAYAMIIEACKQEGRKVSFCGQAASEDAEFAALLVEMGVDILSLAPDALHAVVGRLGT